MFSRQERSPHSFVQRAITTPVRESPLNSGSSHRSGEQRRHLLPTGPQFSTFYCMNETTTPIEITTTLKSIRTELSNLRSTHSSLVSAIDNMLAESLRIRTDETIRSTLPALRELIKIADDWRNRTTIFVNDPERAQLCDEVVEDVTMVLGRQGVDEILPTSRAEFDRDEHRVVATIPVNNPELVGRIAEVHRPGYRGGIGVLRPADVVVYQTDRSTS